MSRAYVCDRCGRMMQEPAMALWTVDPEITGDDDRFRVDLCPECYARFKAEYLENLLQEGLE